MALRVGINGFGRIGRMVLRAALESRREDIEFVAINDLGSTEANAHLLRYDSVHGRFPRDVAITNGKIQIDGMTGIEVLSERDPARLPWNDLGVDLVMECTGLFTSREKAAAHLSGGARKVLISAPANDSDLTVVYGVNHDKITQEHQVISNASCTTNCLAPLAAVLHGTVGIEKGFMTTIHSYTGDQPTVDSLHKDLHRARAAALSMIPTSTGAARAVGLVLPELSGKLDGVAIRVPTPNVSMVDFTFSATRATSVEEIHDAVREAADGSLQGILGVSTDPLVSVDFNHTNESSIVDFDGTKVIEGTFVRVMAWYDNEWGFSNRMSDVGVVIGQNL